MLGRKGEPWEETGFLVMGRKGQKGVQEGCWVMGREVSKRVAETVMGARKERGKKGNKDGAQCCGRKEQKVHQEW